MKELSIEEKAKAYDEAIKKAESLYNAAEPMSGCNVIIETIFPELKESEDKRIRQKFIHLVKMSNEVGGFALHKWEADEMLAWLEKQGEHANFRNKIQIGDKVTRNRDGVLVNLSQLNRVAKKDERQGENFPILSNSSNIGKGEQKPDDKAEPKFKAGDWAVSKFDGKARQISEVHYDEYNNYYVVGSHEYDIEDYDRLHHLWTIQDAKAGDVLSFNDGHGNDSIELIKSITDKKIEFWFCLTNGNRYEVFDGITPYTNLISREDATPATKEQRDLLFKKMHEAGYEWDAEKKELKKIEQKTVWSKEDESLRRRCIGAIDMANLSDYTKDNLLNWLKSLKDRYLPQPKQDRK